MEWGTSGIVSKKMLNYISNLGVDSLDKEYGFTIKTLVYHWKFKPAIQQFAELVNIGNTIQMMAMDYGLWLLI